MITIRETAWPQSSPVNRATVPAASLSLAITVILALRAVAVDRIAVIRSE